MDVSIIIVNYNTSKLIIDCVKSIINLTQGVEYEIIIVDNNSEPEFENTIRGGANLKKEQNCKFLGLPENIGFGRANNEGIKIARGRNIFFLNPDTILLNNAIKILSNFLDTHPKVGACGGNLIDADGNPTHSYKRILPGVFWEFNELLNNYPQKLIYGNINHYYNITNKPIKVGFITGADLMVKREVLEKTGTFSDEFFMYFEETDLCNRIHKSGYQIYSVPEAKICHLESKSFTADGAWQSELKTKLMEESRKIYYKRNTGKFKRRISNILYELFLNSRISLIKNTKKQEYYILRKLYYHNKNRIKEESNS